MSSHDLCFRAKNKKNVYICKPQYYCIKGINHMDRYVIMMTSNTLKPRGYWPFRYTGKHCSRVLNIYRRTSQLGYGIQFTPNKSNGNE